MVAISGIAPEHCSRHVHAKIESAMMRLPPTGGCRALSERLSNSYWMNAGEDRELRHGEHEQASGTDAFGCTPASPIPGEVSPMTWSGTFPSVLFHRPC